MAETNLQIKEGFEVQVDGVPVRFDRCAHCGALPLNEEILKAARDAFHAQSTAVCAICENRVKVLYVTLEHRYSDAWGAPPLKWVGFPMVEETIRVDWFFRNHKEKKTQRIHASLHLDCFTRVAPLAKIEE